MRLVLLLRCVVFLNYPRSVEDGDIQGQERKLLQTVDMIISKKKR